MALVEDSTSEEFVTALSNIFEDLEVSHGDEETDSFEALHPPPNFNNFLECHKEGISCSTPKRAYHRFLRKRILHDGDNSASPLPSKTPEEVAKLVVPKSAASPLPKLPPVILTPWSQMIRDAILKREQKIKKPAVNGPQRMSMRL